MPSSARPASGVLRSAWLYALIFAASVLAYAPALKGGFIWDDDGHVTTPDLQSWSGLGRIWFDLGATQQYYPLVHSAFWAEHRLWGNHAEAYHWANLLLHVLASCLVVVAARRLRIPGAAWAGLLFALHPVAVESVAWISEEKNTLSTIFYLLAFLAYCRFEARRTRTRYASASALFFAALACKTVTATLPAAILVLAWWRRGKVTRSDVLPLIPWVALGAGMGLLTAWVERHLIGAEGAEFALNFAQRLLIAGRCVWFYLAKDVWPAHLLFIYPRWRLDPGAGWQWLFPAATLAVLAAAWQYRRRSRAPLAALLIFGGTLVPVMGFLNIYPFLFSFVADHFQYLARLAILVPAAAGFEAWRCRRVGATRLAALGAAVAVLGVLGWKSWDQTRRYRNAYTLYTTELAEEPGCWLFHHNLGTWYSAAGRSADAIAEYREALRLNPSYARSEYNWGNELAKLGQDRAALAHFEAALRLQPDFASAFVNLGLARLRLHDGPGAIADLRRAVAIDPRSAMGWQNLAAAQLSLHDYDEVLDSAAHVAALAPGNVDARLDRAHALEWQGKNLEASHAFGEAAALAPQRTEIAADVGRTLLKAGLAADAIPWLERALRTRESDLDSRNNLAVALVGVGRFADAVGQMEIAVAQAPDRADLKRNLAIVREKAQSTAR